MLQNSMSITTVLAMTASVCRSILDFVYYYYFNEGKSLILYKGMDESETICREFDRHTFATLRSPVGIVTI